MHRRQALTTLLLPAAASACASRTDETRQDSVGVQLLSEFWAKVYNPPPDFDTIDRLCTEDFILTTAGTDVVGRAAFKEWVRSFSAKIRELRLTSRDMFGSADGTRVVSRWVVTGFNQGILNTPPDDRPIEFTGIAVWEVRDGKLAHNWVERSAYELAQRLAQPAPPGPDPR
ncbi:ester cyclase [Nannocystis punicea]|uniref:Nuclear transport factor 2 family protein n=1 Tax=Nannocystis punicea TaxID=2995304 RepID=A0ABY7HES6_9BACT|nr:nuclear transport factor 2 family protein [Nannocystis poenicansa]WAS97785.1 nuclear transport factor 2 family protein [Nannocystis poenicansa]